MEAKIYFAVKVVCALFVFYHLWALANAEIVEKIAAKMYRVHFGYMSMNSVMKVMKDMGLEQKNQKFDMECSIDTSVRLSLTESFKERMEDVEGCRLEEL